MGNGDPEGLTYRIMAEQEAATHRIVTSRIDDDHHFYRYLYLGSRRNASDISDPATN
jgi:hypothetical protein